MRHRRLCRPQSRASRDRVVDDDDEVSHALFDAELSALYREIYLRLARYLASCESDQTLVEEVITDAFLVAWRDWHTVRGYDNPEAYVFKVATTLWRSRRKRRETQRRELAADVPDQIGAPDPAQTVTVDMHLHDLLSVLSNRQRQVLLLEYVYGFGISAIADVLRVSEGTVKRCGHDGRARLAALLAREGRG